jgi:hypothetical protein
MKEEGNGEKKEARMKEKRKRKGDRRETREMTLTEGRKIMKRRERHWVGHVSILSSLMP